MLDWLFGDPLAPGTFAPGFELPDDSGRRVSLARLRGHNVVLIFYPGDDTAICRKQLCEFRDQWKDAAELNTKVFGINPESQASHHKFRDKFKLPFPLLVDDAQKVARLYNAGGLIVRRTVYLIDPEGVIRYAQRGKPEPVEVLAAAR